jgi:glycosyltransferase involved in cell wall biosynthesis
VHIWVKDGDRRLQEGDEYGRISAGLSRALIELGHEVSFQELPGVEAVLFICPLHRIKFGRSMVTAAIVTQELDGLSLGAPESLDIMERLDIVIVPTERDRALCHEMGVSTPIATVPLGIDPELYFPVTGHRCTFLCVHEGLGSESSRTDWRGTLCSYFLAFKGEQQVRLLINTWKWEPERFDQARLEILAELGMDASAAPTIDVVDGGQSPEQMRDLYQRAWLFVENTSYECWSVACAEALACGAPVAATGIRTLRSQLPEDTRWFGVGEERQLKDVLEHEYLRFMVHLRNCQRHRAATTAKLIELALMGALGQSACAEDPDLRADVAR